MIDRALNLLSDERLAQLAATGSDPAFATLYRRYSGTLFAYCRSITRNSDDGWDALQNAMVKVLVALRRTERTAPIRPWLFCIAHNESIGILRRRSASERVAGALTTTTVPGADEQAESRERITEVVSDVQQLPTSQRAALVMRELGDLRYEEIAVALATTEGNARQLVFAARAGLKDSRAGRGLPCESVRDQLSLADGRLLRRRSVRAHLRTCEGCRSYASGIRHAGGRMPARALGAWSPLAGYNLLESIMRAAAGPAGAGLAQGGPSLLGSFAARAVALSAVAVIGLGAADAVEQKPAHGRAARAAGAPATRDSSSPKVVAAAPAGAPSSTAAVLPIAPVAASARAVRSTVAAPARHSTSSHRLAAAAPQRRQPAAVRTPVQRGEEADPDRPARDSRAPADCPSGTSTDSTEPHRESARYEQREPSQQPAATASPQPPSDTTLGAPRQQQLATGSGPTAGAR